MQAVLVSQEEVEEQSALVTELRKALEELRSEHEYATHRRAAEWAEEARAAAEERDLQLQVSLKLVYVPDK
jgi:hypothetical protein